MSYKNIFLQKESNPDFLPRITAELALDPGFEKWMLRPV